MKQKLHYLLLVSILACSTTALWAQAEIDINGNGRPYSKIFDSLVPALYPHGYLMVLYTTGYINGAALTFGRAGILRL